MNHNIRSAQGAKNTVKIPLMLKANVAGSVKVHAVIGAPSSTATCVLQKSIFTPKYATFRLQQNASDLPKSMALIPLRDVAMDRIRNWIQDNFVDVPQELLHQSNTFKCGAQSSDALFALVASPTEVGSLCTGSHSVSNPRGQCRTCRADNSRFIFRDP
jgi:hypothetical protein